MKKRVFVYLQSLLVVSFLLLSHSCTTDKSLLIETPLSSEQVTSQSDKVLKQWMDSVSAATAGYYNNKKITINGLTMPLAWTIFAKAGEEDLSLYISLHGGGGAPAELNDQQWHNQQVLYAPRHAVYLCPRAPFNTWDLHFRPESDAFYRQIIHMAVTHLHVNPDKVYIMGYSAGGDGVWRLAPRMADTWAAASMMAGHPGDVSLVNLRNTPFMIWCGEKDSAYERNLRCQERINEMDSLHRADPEGYIFEGHIVSGKEHWMDRVDTTAVSWMAKYKRNPYPKRIVWKQEEVLYPHFYWVSAPKNELSRGKEVRAEIEGNAIRITKCDYSCLTISLNDKMLNLDLPVKVVYSDDSQSDNSSEMILFEGNVQRLSSTLKKTLSERGDPSYMFPAQIQINLK